MRSRKYRVVTTLERGSNWLIRSWLRAGHAPQVPGGRGGLLLDAGAEVLAAMARASGYT